MAFLCNTMIEIKLTVKDDLFSCSQMDIEEFVFKSIKLNFPIRKVYSTSCNCIL